MDFITSRCHLGSCHTVDPPELVVMGNKDMENFFLFSHPNRLYIVPVSSVFNERHTDPFRKRKS